MRRTNPKEESEESEDSAGRRSRCCCLPGGIILGDSGAVRHQTRGHAPTIRRIQPPGNEEEDEESEESEEHASTTTATPVPSNFWMKMHESFVAEAKGSEADVVFLGDSLIQYMKNFDVWKKFFEPLGSLNFGIGGDQTQHVLWRVQNGELQGFSPRIVVLLVGTNNFADSASAVAAGVFSVVEAVLSRQEETRVIAVEIPPKGQKPNRSRETFAAVNAIVAEKLSGVERARFLSIGWSAWVGEGGEISNLDMFDYLHFTQRGYEKLCQPLAEEIQNVLGEFGPQ